MSDLAAAKTTARKRAAARRRAVRSAGAERAALARLGAMLAEHAGACLAGYMAMGDELDPLPVMTAWAAAAPVCLPVVERAGRPLTFREWTPGAGMVAATFGTRIPAGGATLVPDLLIVPLLAFDRAGYRLGYGGGFYDRTLAALRAAQPIHAVGVAFAGQETERVPAGPTDAPLDAVVTEHEVVRVHS